MMQNIYRNMQPDAFIHKSRNMQQKNISMTYANTFMIYAEIYVVCTRYRQKNNMQKYAFISFHMPIYAIHNMQIHVNTSIYMPYMHKSHQQPFMT